MGIYPHTAYAEAVHTELAAVGLAPASTTVSINDAHPARDLTITVVWPAGDRLLIEGRWGRGMHLVWRHIHGWHVDDPATLLSRPLPIPLMASPGAMIDTAYAMGKSGMYDRDGQPVELPGSAETWEHARRLDAELADWEAHW